MFALCAMLIFAEPTAQEAAVLQKLERQELIAAREAAQSILSTEPHSVIANWAMAVAQEELEGNQARALFYLHRAEQHCDSEWHERILVRQFRMLHDMDRNEEAIAVLDRHDAMYPAYLPARRIWPLFKLGRIAEALAIGKTAIESQEYETRLTGYNGILALTAEQHDREGAFDWAKRGINATQGKSCILYRNGAGAAFIRFRLEEAEDFAQRAAKAPDRDCAGSRGYDQLAGLYLVEGEYQKGLAALQKLNAEPLPPYLRPSYALTGRWILMFALHVLGKVERAETLGAELYAMPQRMGMVSSDEDVEALIRTFHYHAALTTRMELEREQRSYASFFSLPSLAPLRMKLKRWELHRALLQVLTRKTALIDSVRPNLVTNPHEWPAFLVGDLIDVVGSGVFSKALQTARAMDIGYPEAGAYFDAFEGEAAYRDGEYEDAIALAGQALGSLDKHEALLRFRTMAWQADAMSRIGRLNDAVGSFQRVLDEFPSVLRMLQIAVPATLTNDGSDLAREAASKLAGSRRFEIQKEAPFALDVSLHGKKIEICLRNGNGMQISCSTGEDVITALNAFHSDCFSPRVALGQLDLNSLDGSNGRSSADDALKAVMPP